MVILSFNPTPQPLQPRSETTCVRLLEIKRRCRQVIHLWQWEVNMFRNINVIALWTAWKRREVDECLTRKEAKWYANERSSAEEQPLIFKVVFTNTVSIKDNKHSTSLTNIARSSRVYKKKFRGRTDYTFWNI